MGLHLGHRASPCRGVRSGSVALGVGLGRWLGRSVRLDGGSRSGRSVGWRRRGCRLGASAGAVGSVSCRSVVGLGRACCSAVAAWAFLSGASTMVMLRPSSLGKTSTRAGVRPRARRRGRGSACPARGVHLAATEHDRDLDLVTFAEELLDLAGLGVEVAATDLGAVLHLLDDDVGALASGFLGLLGCLVLVLAVVHDPADRWVGLVGHLDEVEIELTGHGQCLGQRLDADLRAVGADEADLAGPDPVVDPGLVVGRRRSYRRSLLINAQVLLSRADGLRCRRMRRRRTPKTTKRTPESRRPHDAGDAIGSTHRRSTRTHRSGGRVGAEPRFP